jgi:transcriptional regulator with XRE-family HTH domain
MPDMAIADLPYADIGARLRQVRLGFSSMSQREWAEKHGFPATRYNNWETGARRIPVDEAERLCELYGLTLDAIYRGRLDGLSEYARKVF